MNSKGFVALLAIFFLAVITSAGLADQKDVETIKVTGGGSTLSEARLDAIRQATQQVSSQILIADREISNDAIVKDFVASTMFGYIEEFDVESVGYTEFGVELTAYVTVSRNLMMSASNTLSSEGGFDGQSIFTEALRQDEQKRVYRALMENFFRDFPEAAYNYEIGFLQAHDGNLEFNLKLSRDDAFFNDMIRFLDAVAIAKCPLPKNIFATHPSEFRNMLASEKCEILKSVESAKRWAETEAAPNIYYSKNPYDLGDLDLPDGQVITTFCSGRIDGCYLFNFAAVKDNGSLDFSCKLVKDGVQIGVYSRVVDNLTGLEGLGDFSSSLVRPVSQPSAWSKDVNFDLALVISNAIGPTLRTGDAFLVNIGATYLSRHPFDVYKAQGGYSDRVLRLINEGHFKISVPISLVDVEKSTEIKVVPAIRNSSCR